MRKNGPQCRVNKGEEDCGQDRAESAPKGNLDNKSDEPKILPYRGPFDSVRFFLIKGVHYRSERSWRTKVGVDEQKLNMKPNPWGT